MKNEEKLLELLGALCEKLDKLIVLLEPATPAQGLPPPGPSGHAVEPMYGIRVLPRREEKKP